MGIDPADARAFPGFAQLDDRSIDDLRARMRPVRLRPGETLFHRGERNASLYLLFRGDVDIVETDGERAVATRRARTVIGELGLLLDVPRTATVVAATDVLCWEITQQAFSAAIDRGEPWAARLALAVATELAARFVDVRGELTRLDTTTNGPSHRPAELEQLRNRLLAEWAF